LAPDNCCDARQLTDTGNIRLTLGDSHTTSWSIEYSLQGVELFFWQLASARPEGSSPSSAQL